MKKTGTRAVGYVRVSTEEQVDGHSLDAQRREIQRYCERFGLTLTQVYADEGVSAHTDQIERRPQLSALLRDAGRQNFDVVVVHTIDRWARNMRVQSEALQRLGKADVGFVSVSENMDYTTPSGRLTLTMMGGVSEFFSDQLGLHVLKAQRQRAEIGLPIGPLPFGYVSTDARATPMIEPREGEAVRRVFTSRAAGQSNGVIAASLNREGFRTRKGHLFTPFAVKDMLRCRFYLGRIVFRGEEFLARHEALIDEALFERVQARRSRRGASRHAEGRARGILSGLIRCARCQSTLHAERGHLGRPMYRERHGVECETNHRSFMADRVDEQIASIIGSLELPEDWRSRIANRAAREGGTSVADLRAKRRRLARAYADGGYTLADYEARMAALDSEIRLAEADVPLEATEVAGLLRDLPGLWQESTPDERRQLVAPLVERVYVDVAAKRLCGIVPVPAFRALLEAGMKRTAGSSAVLIAPSDSPAQGILELVETGENRTPRPERA